MRAPERTSAGQIALQMTGTNAYPDGAHEQANSPCVEALSEGSVFALSYVARRRAELGLNHVDVAVPQGHLPGAEAEVDFGEFHAVIARVLLKLWLFVLRLSCSGRAFHIARRRSTRAQASHRPRGRRPARRDRRPGTADSPGLRCRDTVGRD